MMRIHVLQHVAFEGPAAILTWAQQKNAAITITRFYEEGWNLPSVLEFDLLVMMGGPMSVHDENAYPWLAMEKQCIREAIAAGKKILGICLGAQLSAEALGAAVRPNREKEIGWFPIFKTSLHHSVFWHMPEKQHVFHWHGETFDLPDGAIQLAHSEACAQQAFIWNDQVLGLQYHIEMGEEEIEAIIEGCGDELHARGDFIQTPSGIRAGYTHIAALRPMLFRMLDQLMKA